MIEAPDRAAIYRRSGGKLEAVSLEALARGVLSPRLALTPARRGVALYYGACAERLSAGNARGQTFAERVDGGRAGDGGALALAHMRWAHEVARDALGAMPPVTFAARSASETGAHLPAPVRVIVDAVCAHGLTLETVARGLGWYVIRDGARVVPARQREKIKAGLEAGLDTILDAWSAEGIRLPAWVGTIEVG